MSGCVPKAPITLASFGFRGVKETCKSASMPTTAPVMIEPMVDTTSTQDVPFHDADSVVSTTDDSPPTSDKHRMKQPHRPVINTVACAWCINDTKVPMVDADGDPVNEVADFGQTVYTELSKDCSRWVYKAVSKQCIKAGCRKALGRGERFVFTQSETFAKLKSALDSSMGKHTRGFWKVSLDGQPVDKDATIDVTVDGVTVELQACKKPMRMKLTTDALQWLAQSVSADTM